MKRATAFAAIVLDCLQPFRRKSLCMCATQSKIAKNTKTTDFGGLRPFKVIEVNTLIKLVISACYDKQHVRAYL